LNERELHPTALQSFEAQLLSAPRKKDKKWEGKEEIRKEREGAVR
jgi:hypothetical protein